MDHLQLLEYLKGTLEESEKSSVEAWLAASEANQRVLEQLKLVWEHSEAKAPEPDIAAAWKKVQPTAAPQKGKPMRRFWLQGIAAAVILLIVTASWLWLSRTRMEILQQGELAATAPHVLPDGSRVWLNRNTTLSYPVSFGSNSREVVLTGEAFFEVERDTTRPFFIQAGQSGVQVLGTSFNVRAYPDSQHTQVQVSTGRVAFFSREDPSQRIELGKGEGAAYAFQDQKIKRLAAPQPNRLAWRTRTLEFRQTPMSQVARQLSDLYHIKVEFSNPDIATCTLSATFEDEPLESVINTLKLLFDLEATLTENTLTLSGKGCSPTPQ